MSDIHKDQLKQLGEALKKHPTVKTASQTPVIPAVPIEDEVPTSTTFKLRPQSNPKKPVGHSLDTLGEILSSLTEKCTVCDGTGEYTNFYSDKKEECSICLGSGNVPTPFGIKILEFVKEYIGEI